MEESAALQTEAEQLRHKNISLAISVERSIHLGEQVSDLQNSLHRQKLSAQDDLRCAQEQLKQAQDMMKATISDLSSRIAKLKQDLIVQPPYALCINSFPKCFSSTFTYAAGQRGHRHNA